MQKELDVDGSLSKSIQNAICKKVYEYVNKYSGSNFASLEIFYEELVNHPQFSREGTKIKDKKNKGSYIQNELF